MTETRIGRVVGGARAAGWRARGFDDAKAGRPRRSGEFPDAKSRTAYMDGYRAGAREREKEAGAREGSHEREEDVMRYGF